jgi:hypothetical protein
MVRGDQGGSRSGNKGDCGRVIRRALCGVWGFIPGFAASLGGAVPGGDGFAGGPGAVWGKILSGFTSWVQLVGGRLSGCWARFGAVLPPGCSC